MPIWFKIPFHETNVYFRSFILVRLYLPGLSYDIQPLVFLHLLSTCLTLTKIKLNLKMVWYKHSQWTENAASVKNT